MKDNKTEALTIEQPAARSEEGATCRCCGSSALLVQPPILYGPYCGACAKRAALCRALIIKSEGA